MHRHAFHYKARLLGICPVWVSDTEDEEPIVAERHWTLLPLFWLCNVMAMTMYAIADLMGWDYAPGFLVTAYIDPPRYMDCRCDEVDDDG